MKFIEKTASYYETYLRADAKDGLLKTAAVDGVSYGDLIAFHNLTQGNMFTGRNLIKLAEEDMKTSKLVQLGEAIDRLNNQEITKQDLYKIASDLGMDAEDVDFVLDQIEKQAEEALGVNKEASPSDKDHDGKPDAEEDHGTLPKGFKGTHKDAERLKKEKNASFEEYAEKVAEAMDYLASNNIDPYDGLYIAAHVEGDGIADEKVAAEVAEAGFTEEDIQHIAKVAEYLGGVDERALEIAKMLMEEV